MNAALDLSAISAALETVKTSTPVGRVAGVAAGLIEVRDIEGAVALGDSIRIDRLGQPALMGEVVQLHEGAVMVLPEAMPSGVPLGARAVPVAARQIAPSEAWLGRIIGPDAQPLDGKPLTRGDRPRPFRAAPPKAALRRALGPRLSTGLAVTNTLLPLVHGQRIGLFAGSGVGKSTLLGTFAERLEADVVVVALVGERGREVRHFVDTVIGPEGLARTVVVAATSDQSALQRRRCAWTAATVAEHFRDEGKSVLLLIDSITRFAEAHREIAVAAGEAPVLRGYPPSTSHEIMSLAERAGPGTGDQGDITAVFSVLVAGSDMEEPIADILRGVLDGHIVLDREIAERGRYPAVDVLRSVSRSLPVAADEAENALIAQARRLLGVYDRNAVMIRAGLYAQGSDPEVDMAVAVYPELDQFLAQPAPEDCAQSFQQLELLLRRAKAAPLRP